MSTEKRGQMAKKKTTTPEAELLEWFSTRRTTRVDIVGDFAGGELFAIHGESLIRYCLEQSRVDFDGGFQLLHAVYAVESFLQELQRRGCNFDLIFFRDMQHVCMPQQNRDVAAYKYHLARAVLIRHLSRSDIRSGIREFHSFESDDCHEYLASHVIHFIMVHAGTEDKDESQVPLRYLMWQFVSSGIHVAIINDITLQNSKAFVHLLSGTEISTNHLDVEQHHTAQELSPLSNEIIKNVSVLGSDSTAGSLREWIVIIFCRGLLEQHPADKLHQNTLTQIFALVLHVTVLRLYSVKDRRCETHALSPEDDSFLRNFSEVSQTMVERGLGNEKLSWDLYDLIDGRMFSLILHKLRSKIPIPNVVVEEARSFWHDIIREGVAYSKGKFDVTSQPHSPLGSQPQEPVRPRSEILAFSHPAFDQFLGSVKVDETQETTDSTAGMVFQDLQHWHNNKPIVSLKNSPKPGFWAMRFKQTMMTEILRYAESLQGSRGKVFERETVIAGSRNAKRSAAGGGEMPERPIRRNNGPKKSNKKGGKASAYQAALELQNRKASAKRNDVARFWARQCVEFQENATLIEQYSKAQEFLFTRSKIDRKYIEPEIQLYLCHVLSKIWVATRKNMDGESSQGIYLISMMWNLMQEIAKSEASTPELAKGVLDITTSLDMPLLRVSIGEPSRLLPFYLKTDALKTTGRIVSDYRLLQLEHGGPYMERRFDSKPDPRVPFEPDAWQRQVLDSIDADESLLVIAPTSAGKTFISFYAMKGVLEESDDAVLVYVAPTKALVSQIAAEIEARFSKTYNGRPGKSVWAIHTRDYRINNPSQCQILVTVPHILQIMLLSPVNASRANNWSRRVKRIIFDEVHCIGQADDGVVWEQLLLMAPCPIIALSATVGNPEEFRHWLEVSQTQKGFKMKMVVHGVRYSDLRKFIYHSPPCDTAFKELSKPLQLPVPGLDEGELPSSNFKFVHPVLALNNRHRETLDDVNLEPRDCLTLWESMKESLPSNLQSEVLCFDPKLALPEIICKSDIVKWEASLKKVLRKAMETSESSLKILQAGLGPLPPSTGTAESTIGEKEGKDPVKSLFFLVCELHSQNALPALVFNYDRLECERAVKHIFTKLESNEQEWKRSDPTWLNRLASYEQWKKEISSVRVAKPLARDKADKDGDSNMSKLDLAREAASVEISPWQSFDPDAPLPQFSLSDTTKMAKAEFDEMINKLHRDKKVKPGLIKALERGLGVHHAGMNRRYRQIVEVMFRNGYLRVVVATGTLALGINMPCKTVVFNGDSVFLTAQNYRQAAGRSGRRGFDLLGNVVFNGIPQNRVYEIMSSRLPDLKGQFAVSTTLILRLFGLLHGTGNSDFAIDSVRALISQTRLYMGGPDAEMSVKHHLRFSIEYLRRQSLLSENGTPLNFAGLVGHLYFTENAVFAFHSLLRGGYFHQLCADIDNSSEKILLELMLVLGHLFNRIPVQRTKTLEKKVHRASSIVFLPRLPQAAEAMLVQHNQETLSIFKEYVYSYISQFLVDKPDRTMPFTQTDVGPSNSSHPGFFGCTSTTIRSPFVALSGFGDEFETIQELCTTVRGDVFLEESAIPHIPIWPHDTNTEFNAYLLDFYKHGSLEDLKRNNQIKGGDVWFYLKDFSLVLKTIVSSLKSLTGAGTDPFDFESDEWDQGGDDDDGGITTESQSPVEAKPLGTASKSEDKKPSKVLDSWEDDDDSESNEETNMSDYSESIPMSISSAEGGEGLAKVLKAFAMLQENFESKFQKMWA